MQLLAAEPARVFRHSQARESATSQTRREPAKVYTGWFWKQCGAVSLLSTRSFRNLVERNMHCAVFSGGRIDTRGNYSCVAF